MKTLFKVIAQSEPVNVQKQDGSTIKKSTVVLQLTGGKYDEQLGDYLPIAQCILKSITDEMLSNPQKA